MFAMECNDLRIVSESINGQRSIDQHTTEAVVSLAEKLDQLKASSRLFSNVGFSPNVESLLPNSVAFA
ncbi:MAG: hypothetical protein JXA82_18835 [Sedimentisphaerales bacterium]|nr:hypothetical protein [Sedimentisphaerales bacterium]